MGPFDITPFASSNQAASELFNREFALRRARQGALENEAQSQLAREQIGAQSRLAQAQLQSQQQQQQFSNLLNILKLKDEMDTGKERNALLNRQLDIQKPYYESMGKYYELGGRGGPQSAERTKQDQDYFNAQAQALADEFDATYQANLNAKKTALNAERRAKLDALITVGGLFNRKGATDAINTDYSQKIKDLEDAEFANTVALFHARGGNAAGMLKVDVQNKKFIPVQIGDTSGIGAGNVGLQTATGGLSDTNPAALGARLTPPAPGLGAPIRIPAPGNIGQYEVSPETAAQVATQINGMTPDRLRIIYPQLLRALEARGEARFIGPTNLAPPFTVPTPDTDPFTDNPDRSWGEQFLRTMSGFPR